MGRHDQTRADLKARDLCNTTWLGWTVTVTDRATGQAVTDRIGDYWLDATRGHVWLYMVTAGQVELRADDPVLFDGLGLIGGVA